MADRTITCGDGKTYASLNAGLAAEFAARPDLTTAGGVLTIECYFISGGDGTAISWPAFTNATSSNYIKVVAVDRHAGVPNTTTAYYRNGANIASPTAYTQLLGLQVFCNATAIQLTKANCLVDGCLVKSAASSGFTCSDAAEGTIWRNCIAYECARHGFWAVPDSGAVTIHNCTAVGCGTEAGTYYGFYRQGGTVTITNCLAQDNSDGDYSGAFTMTYCVSKDATASGTGCVASYTDDPFVSAGSPNYNYHVATPNTTLIGTGANLYSTFTGDIDALTGTRPSGAFTIGADEPAAASGRATRNPRSHPLGVRSGMGFGIGGGL